MITLNDYRDLTLQGVLSDGLYVLAYTIGSVVGLSLFGLAAIGLPIRLLWLAGVR